jgi:hypothetical protein
MGNGTDRRKEIHSCTIMDMRKIEPLRGYNFENKIQNEIMTTSGQTE